MQKVVCAMTIVEIHTIAVKHLRRRRKTGRTRNSLSGIAGGLWKTSSVILSSPQVFV